MEGIRGWLAQLIQPDLSIEAPAVDHQSVAFPLACRITMPGRSDILAGYEFTAIEEGLPPEVERFVDKEDLSRRLNDAPRRRREKDLGHTLGQAIRIGILFPTQSRCALVVDRLCPWLELDLVWLQVRSEVPDIPGRWIPDSGQIRLAIGQARRRSRKIRLSIRRARNVARWNIFPLRRQWNGNQR